MCSSTSHASNCCRCLESGAGSFPAACGVVVGVAVGAGVRCAMSEYLHRSHNVTVLLYHLVFPAKYRRAVVDAGVDGVLRDVCLAIEARYQLKFLEIGTDRDHVHFLVQAAPTYSVTKLVTTIKSLTAREIFRHCPQVKRQLW